MDLSGICKLKKKQHKIYIYWLIIVLVFDYLLFPLPILAKETPKTIKFRPVYDFRSAEDAPTITVEKPQETAKIKPIKVIRDHGYHSMTAYSSEAMQTDDDPCSTANGFNVCKHAVEDTVAANFLKFGTKVRIPEVFGERVFIVRDRMNSRYSERVDVWFKNKVDAMKFGYKLAKLEVVE